MSLLVLGSGTSGYQIQRSVRTRVSPAGYFNRTFGTPTNASRWTKSFWVKRGILGYVPLIAAQTINATANYAAQFNANDTFTWQFSNALVLTTTQVFRDPSAWYHFVLAWDPANATAANKAIIYVNGVQVTAYVTDNRASVSTSQNAWGTAGSGFISYNNVTNTFDGYLAEINFVDGQVLTQSSFGEYNSVTNVWQPKQYTGTYGANGFYLKFSDNSASTAAALGKDYSGNNNNWTPNNILVTGRQNDSMTDVPTLNSPTSSNFAVMNPLARTTFVASSSPPSSGNLVIYQASTTLWAEVIGTIGVSSGKWYWEVSAENIGTSSYLLLGVCSEAEFGALVSTNKYVGSTASSWGYYAQNGQKYNNNVGTSYGAAYATNDVIGIALDMDAGTLTFYKNNVSQGVAFTGFTGVIYPAFSSISGVGTVNFGQQPFVYTPPTGHLRLNTFNLPAPTIPNGAKQFAATLYTGTGSTQTIANTNNGNNFQPDFVWAKGRSGATNHSLYDSVRGTTKQLIITTAAETTEATGLTAFGSTGFTVGALANLNTNAATYVAWNWKASNAAAVTNTAGTITSQVSANPSAGFSVVTYTGTGVAGATVGHGLGVAPRMIIVKQRTAIGSWGVYHASLGASTYILLNTTAALVNNTMWNNTAPTSSVFTLGSAGFGVNDSSITAVAYCFAEISGYSKFGSYLGTNVVNGPFIPTNFRPRFVMIKEATTARGWIMFDTSRSPYNVVDNYLFAEGSAAAGTLSLIDILSNGFKVRSTNLNVNDTTSSTFIYMAFAENPFSYSLAR